MSTVRATNFQHASAAAPAIVLAADGTAAATVSGINGGPLAGFRNAIINGSYVLWQRATSHSTFGYGSADRWVNAFVGSACTMSRQAFTMGQVDVPGEPRFFCRMAVTSVVGANNYALLGHYIEDARTLAGQTVTVSFLAKASAALPITVELEQFFGTGGSPSNSTTGIGSTKVTLSTSWQKIVVTATLPSVSGKTLGSDNNSSVRLNIWLDAGSTWNTRTISLGQRSGTFDIAQVQVEAGSVATPFEFRPIATEVALCQRYYMMLDNTYKHDCEIGGASVSVGHMVYFPVSPRATPNVSILAQSGTNSSTISMVNTKGVSGVSVYWAWNTAGVIGRDKSFILGIDAEI